MNKIPDFAPGCFGSALHFKSENMVCAACPENKACENLHLINLAKMREKLNIKAPVSGRSKKAPIVAGVPKKVSELIDRINHEKTDVTVMKNRENPFSKETNLKFLRVVCHVIIAIPDGVTQRVLSEALQKYMKWSKGTSDAHARMSLQALQHLNVISVNESGTIKIEI